MAEDSLTGRIRAFNRSSHSSRVITQFFHYVANFLLRILAISGDIALIDPVISGMALMLCSNNLE
jgi:hypothetical protein